MVKDHSDSERRNPLPPHRLLFPISSKGYFICIRQDNTYHGHCYASRGALAGTSIRQDNTYSDNERGNLLTPHRLLFPINSKGFFHIHHPTARITHTTAFVTPVVEHWLERASDRITHTQITREETCCRHIDYSFRLAARLLPYSPSHSQDNT